MMMGNSTYNIDPLAPLEEQIQKTLDNALQVTNRLGTFLRLRMILRPVLTSTPN